MVNEVLYCERLMYLEWAQGEFADNHYTVHGRVVHKRADKPGKPIRKPGAKKAASKTSPEQDEASEAEQEDLPYTARSVWLTSTRLGLTARIDIVEADREGVVPIEYKRGKAPDLPDGAWLPERAQLMAQALLLRDHGYTVERAEIYFAGDRKRVPIELSAELEAETRGAIARAKELTEAGAIPEPLLDSPKCSGCSLVGICLPDEVNLLSIGESEPSASEATEPQLRRLHPARDERLPVYVQAHAARIGLSGDCLVIKTPEGKQEARLPNTSQLAVFGNVQLTTPAMRALLDREIPLTFFSYGGWFLGRLVGHGSKNVELRVAQHRGAADRSFCVKLARGLVASKILNCRTLYRRNAESPDATTLGELERLAQAAREAVSLESLLGYEGTAARLYFSVFNQMLKGQAAVGAFDMHGRNRRPPRDPINAMLSFAYSLLAKELALMCANVGLDPMLGFYHQLRYGRPALALDLMEEFRPIVADSVVVAALNNGVLTESDFVRSHVGVAMRRPGRKRFIAAYERRMDQLVTHPVFGYRVSYRRVFEIQARLLGRVLLGELEEYPEFRTR
ncbi:MAG: CRISPR-associated endonuclease Cas1 [Deltaproteobacteria bacterium]|nr:CRISPR-associated endonuclease Cas1 [Deltaproteobacteria bacterium]